MSLEKDRIEKIGDARYNICDHEKKFRLIAQICELVFPEKILGSKLNGEDLQSRSHLGMHISWSKMLEHQWCTAISRPRFTASDIHANLLDIETT